MSLFLTILELTGTVAFAISGTLTGIRRHLDVFGVAFLGIVTAVGGGILRDLMIGVTPPLCFRDPVYLIVACVTSLLFFLPFVHRPLIERQAAFDMVLFITDSLGLAVFTVSGIEAALQASPSYGVVLLAFVGMLTATGGGVLRDMLVAQTPYIFLKHIYATAALAGAILYVVLYRAGVNQYLTSILTIAAVFIIRCLALTFKWNLPRAEE